MFKKLYYDFLLNSGKSFGGNPDEECSSLEYRKSHIGAPFPIVWVHFNPYPYV
jgi:hypothetical protein